MKQTPLLAASVVLAVTGFLLADPGKEGAAFLDIPLGGAPSAMGSAYSALATNAYAPVVNPAGLGFLRGAQFAGHHVSYFETSHYEFASFVVPLRSGSALGFAAQYFGTGDIPSVDESGDSLGDFSSHYGAYTASYGQSLNDRLSLGLSGRWINAKIADISANAYAGDAGVLWKASPKIHTSLVVSNFGSSLQFIDQNDSLPLNVRLGAAYLPRSWTASLEGVYEATGLLSARIGGEWRPVQYVALRTGYRTDTNKELSAISGLSTGIGILLSRYEFSYTWMPYGDLGDTHSFALLLKFGDQSNKVIRNYARNDPQEDEFESLRTLLVETDTAVAEGHR